MGGLVGLALAALLIPRRRRREARALHDRVARAREHILADGKVEGPKGAYIPHQKWKDAGTRHDTAPPKARAYDGAPWP